MRRTITTLLCALALLAFSAGAAQADPIPLTTLIAEQGTIVQGDKLFSDFSLIFNPQGPNTAPPDASGILVQGMTFGENYGLEFSGGMFAGVDSTLDLLIGYKVTVLDENQMISDINLIFNGAVTGTGFTSVTETVLKANQIDVIGQASVTNPPQVLSQTIDLSEMVSMAFVKKDIFLNGGSDGTATISFIDQAISQTTPGQEIPEPASLLLLGSGLLGFTGLRRAKRG